MNRAVADKRRSGNEESRGAVMSGAERVEPEVSPTPAEKKTKKKTPETITHRDAHTHTHTHVHADTHSHCVLANCSIHLLKNTGIWITPRSWKQTLWILKDFDAFIKDWLRFEFIWIVLCDVHETSNMLWILMARWAVCDKWWNIFECCAVLGWLLGAVSLRLFTVLWKFSRKNLAGINSLKSFVFKHSSEFSAALELKKTGSGLKTHERL